MGTQQQLLKQSLRRCVSCNEIKPLTEFYLRGDGYYTSQCILCIREDVRESYRVNPIPHKEYQKQFAKDNAEYYRDYRINHLEKHIAGNEARKIPTKNYCEDCGRTREELALLGIKLQRHHDNYSKPKEFRTLCEECHGKTRRKS
jgi:hypothetical protein